MLNVPTIDENKLLAILYSPETSQHQFIYEHFTSIKTMRVCFSRNTFGPTQMLLHTYRLQTQQCNQNSMFRFSYLKCNSLF